MKTKGIIISVALVAAAIVAATMWLQRASDWDFVRRVTGFDFPPTTEYLAQYDNAEWFVVSVVRIPASTISQFARDHRFVAGERHRLRTAFSLPERYRIVPDRSDVLSASGQKEYQAWEAVLDPQSGLLWVHVGYPDWSGDHPGTAPQPPNKSVETTRGTQPKFAWRDSAPHLPLVGSTHCTLARACLTSNRSAKMKIELQVPAPFPALLSHQAPEGVTVSFPDFIETRGGGFHDINWIEVTVSTAAGYAFPKVMDFLASTLKKIPARIKTKRGFEEFTPAVVERMLRMEREAKSEKK